MSYNVFKQIKHPFYLKYLITLVIAENNKNHTPQPTTTIHLSLLPKMYNSVMIACQINIPIIIFIIVFLSPLFAEALLTDACCLG